MRAQQDNAVGNADPIADLLMATTFAPLSVLILNDLGHWASRDMCVHVCADVCIDRCMNMCVHACVQTCADTSADMCVDMYADRWHVVDQCGWTCASTCMPAH